MNWLSLVTVLLFAGALGYLFILLRRRMLKERYVWLWLFPLILGIIIAAIPTLAGRLAHMLGFQLPANLLFVGAIAVLFFVCVTLSVSLSSLEGQTRTLTEESAMLRHEIDRLRRVEPVRQQLQDGSDSDDSSSPDDFGPIKRGHRGSEHSDPLS